MDNPNPTIPAVEPKPDDFLVQLKGMTSDECNERIEKDPEFQAEIVMLEPKQLDEVEEAQKKNTLDRSQGGAKPVVASLPQAEADEEDVTLRLKRSDLGLYAPKGRTLGDAVKEMIKGYPVKDRTINSFKERLTPLEMARAEASQRIQALEEENAKLKAEKKPEPPKEESVEIPSLPEDFDNFSEEHVKKLVQGYAAMQKTIARLTKSPEPQVAPQAPVQPQAAPVNNSAQDEYNEIRELQTNPSFSQHLLTNIDIETLNAQYVTFIDSLAGLCGIKEVYSPSGKLTKNASEVVMAYFDQNDLNGQRIRDAAIKAAIKPPEEMDALRRIYRVRECRFIPKNGKMVEIPYEAAAAIAKSRYPEDFTTVNPVKQNVSERERLEAVIDQRKSKAIEVSTAQGGEVLDADAVTKKAYDILGSKNYSEMTDGEVAIVRTAMEKDGYTVEEIDKILPPRKK